jgi:hypothetical protein
MLWGLLLALCAGAGVAVVVRPWEWGASSRESSAERLLEAAAEPTTSPDAALEGVDPSLAAADQPVVEGPASEPDAAASADESPSIVHRPVRGAGSGGVDDDIAAAFAQGTPKKSAMALLRHLRKRFRLVGYPAYEEISRWVKKNKTRHVLETLGYLMKGQHPYRTRRWLSRLMPELY